MSPILTVVLWNVQWRAPATPAGQTILRLIAARNPDLVCLTESHCDALPGQHTITSDSDYGVTTISATRRKVVLWSRQSWRVVDTRGHPDLPKGRFVRGLTATPLGALDVLGVCIPWSNAGVATPAATGNPGSSMTPISKACSRSWREIHLLRARYCLATSTRRCLAPARPKPRMRH